MTDRPHPRDQAHDEAQLLLPWYVTDSLDPAERERLETHLEACGECREELRVERGLRARVATLDLGVEHGWAALRAGLDASPRPASAAAERRPRPRLAPAHRPPARGASGSRRWSVPAFAGGTRVAWAVAAQAGLLLVLGLVVLLPTRPAPYRLLGAAGTARGANAVVIFRPEAREAGLRAALEAGGARLVDGPTAAGAWLVRVPPARRAPALAALRARPEVSLAEPVDPAPS